MALASFALAAWCVAQLPLAGRASAADAPPSLEASARADQLFQQGNTAFETGDLELAYTKYLEAWSLKKGIEIAANLGVVELQLGKPRDAAEHIAYSLRLFPAQGRAEARERLLQKLGEAKAKVATVRVEVSVPGAIVAIDGVEVGAAPLRDELYVEPGLRRFRATRPGYETATARMDLAAGSSSNVDLRPQPLPSTELAPAASPTAPSEPAEPKPLWPAIALGGLTAAGAGVGIGFTLLGLGQESDLESVQCPGGPETCPPEALDQVDRRNTFMSVGGVGFVVGGAALVGLITYLAWPSGSAAPASASAGLRVAPLAGPGLGGLSVGGSF